MYLKRKSNNLVNHDNLSTNAIGTHGVDVTSSNVYIGPKVRRLAVKGGDWDAGFATYPMQRIVQGCKTHAACRYVCDRRRSLRAKLDAYDIILVDEMQDLISAQEQHLLFQT